MDASSVVRYYVIRCMSVAKESDIVLNWQSGYDIGQVSILISAHLLGMLLHVHQRTIS